MIKDYLHKSLSTPYISGATSVGRKHLYDVNARLFLISAIASAGFRPFGHVRLQLRIV